MPSRTLNLEFPAGGIDKRLGFQDQRPFTTPYCLNVRPFDPLDQRRRGGSRPDLVKAFALQLGSGNPVNLLDTMRTTNISGATAFLDEFKGSTDGEILSSYNSNNWESGFSFDNFVGGVSDNAPTTPIAEAFVLVPANVLQMDGISRPGDKGGILATGITSAIATSQTYVITIADVVFLTGHEFHLWFALNATTPADSSSYRVYITLEPGPKYRMEFYLNGVRISTIVRTTLPNFDLEVTVNPNHIKAVWGGEDSGLVINRAVETADSAGGHRMLFVGQSSFSPVQVKYFRIDYFTGSDSPKELVVAASNGILYQEKPAGTMVAVLAATQQLESDPIESVARLGKLYIADFAAPRREETTATSDAVITDGSTHAVLTHSGATFDTAGTTQVYATGDVIEITDSVTSGSAPTNQWYKITSVVSDTVVQYKNLDDTHTAGKTTTSTAYRIIPGLKVYDVATDKLALWTASGTAQIPYGCRHIAKYLDRIVLSGDPNNESTVYFSTQGTPDDWNEVSTQVQSAVFTGSTDGVDQEIGVPVTGLIGYTRDYFLILTDQDIWLVRGDLRQGGSMARLSGSIGMISGRAFSVDDDNNIRWLARNGLYILSHRAVALNEDPEAISRERVPKQLRGIDTDINSVVLGYNPDEGGVYLWVTPLSVGSSTQYFLEPQSGSFIPDALASDHQVFTSAYLGRTNSMLVGCRDGYIRRYDPDGIGDDDGVTRIQEVDYGPIPLNRGRAAMVDSIEFVMGDDADDVKWTFRTGQSAEEAFNAASRASGTISGDVSYRHPVRHYGTWGFLRLSTTTAARWAVEQIKLRIHPAAEQRKI